MRKLLLLVTVLLVTLLQSGTIISQDERAPAGTPPLDQLVYAREGRLERMTFYEDYPIAIDYLTDPNVIYASEPEISDNGQSLAFIGIFDNQTDVFLLESAFNFRQLTDTPAKEEGLQWVGTNPISFTSREYELSEANLVMLDIYNSTTVILAKSVAICCHRWLDEETVAFIPLQFEEPRQISIHEPHVLLPFDGFLPYPSAVSAHARLVLPEIAKSILVDAGRSPTNEFWFGIYSAWDENEKKFFDVMLVADRDGHVLAEMRHVKPGDADWRNLNG